ncbi:RHS repeat-associated core domain-containing protein [Prevotella melaninogenica]|uniref:RHS repeat domain-containing protein n=1 Tax=Prevotella TaxID=838 RepID=UPI00352F91E8
MDNAYTYDAVSNVLSVKNGAPLPQSGKAGGQMSHQYTYDALYRLTRATGAYTGADSKTASYTLAMDYDNMHRITSKAQHLTQQNVQFNGTLGAGYDLTYTYQDSTGHKFQLANVQDVNYRTEGTAGENDKVNNGHRYTYDANGNLVYINTSRVKKDGKEDEKATEQKFKWDEENRLLAADENGFVSNYWYDADGERTVKTSGEGEQIYVNSEFAGGHTNTAKFSLYVSPYLVANQGGRYTKHIYIGSQRIVSKLGDFASYGSDPRRIPYAGSEADAVSVDYKCKYASQQQVIKDNYATFNVPYNGEDNNDYVDGEGFCCNDGTSEAAQEKVMTRSAIDGNFKPNDDYEKMQFYYHPDHLGSSSYITNLDGEVAQHIEYVPFGEVFIEERNNTWNTPYLFNAKEFDEETGMYYYGARYYEPRLSLWMTVDPKMEKYQNVSAYVYCLNNPLKIIDPDGKDIVFLLDREAANGFGHAAVLIGNETSGWKYVSINGTGGGNPWGKNRNPDSGTPIVDSNGKVVTDLKKAVLTANSINSNLKENHSYDDYTRIATSTAEDKQALSAAMKTSKAKYYGVAGPGKSCIDVAQSAFASVANSRKGFNNSGMIEATGEAIPGESDLIPKNWYDKLSKRITRVNMNINNNTGKKNDIQIKQRMHLKYSEKTDNR